MKVLNRVLYLDVYVQSLCLLSRHISGCRAVVRNSPLGCRLLFDRNKKFLAMMLLFAGNMLPLTDLFKPSSLPLLQFNYGIDKVPKLHTI